MADADLDPLRRLLEAALEAAASLRHILEEERELLSRRDAEALAALAPEKLDRLRRLEALEQSRQELQAAAGLGTDPRPLADHPELGASWRQLGAELADLRLLNEGNGAVIRQSLEGTRRDLEVLRGVTGMPAAPAIYTRDGGQQHGQWSQLRTRA